MFDPSISPKDTVSQETFEVTDDYAKLQLTQELN